MTLAWSLSRPSIDGSSGSPLASVVISILVLFAFGWVFWLLREWSVPLIRWVTVYGYTTHQARSTSWHILSIPARPLHFSSPDRSPRRACPYQGLCSSHPWRYIAHLHIGEYNWRLTWKLSHFHPYPHMQQEQWTAFHRFCKVEFGSLGLSDPGRLPKPSWKVDLWDEA